jgi:hypothetical protein
MGAQVKLLGEADAEPMLLNAKLGDFISKHHIRPWMKYLKISKTALGFIDYYVIYQW